jgi:hypothetical protein
MPDTPGKRQRQAAKIRRRETKAERRAVRRAQADDPSHAPSSAGETEMPESGEASDPYTAAPGDSSP